MNVTRALRLLVVAVLPINALGAPVIDLAAILGNVSFEADLFADQWTATKKSDTDRLAATGIDPVIIPKGESDPLDAPLGAGTNFAGVLNPDDSDIDGRLEHDACRPHSRQA